MRRRIVSWGLGLATTVTLVGACTYQDDATVLGSLDNGEVDARVVFIERSKVQVECGEGLLSLCWPGSAHKTAARLEVEGPHPFSVRVPGRLMPFDRVELAADDGGERLAYRRVVSEGHEPWRLVLAGENNHAYVFGMAPIDEQGQPDWIGALSLEEAAPEIFDRSRYKVRRALLEDMETRHGHRGLTELLMSTVESKPRGRQEVRRAQDGAWGNAFDRLPADAQRRVRQRLRHRFLNGKLGAHGVLRSLRYIDLSDRQTLDRMQAKLSRTSTFGRHKLADTIMLRSLIRHRPRRAGKLACERLTTETPGDEILDGGETANNFYRNALLRAIVAGGTQCAVVERIASDVGVTADSATFERLRKKSERIRPRRDFFTSHRKPVPEARMKRVLAAAAAAQAQSSAPPIKQKKRHCRRRQHRRFNP